MAKSGKVRTAAINPVTQLASIKEYFESIDIPDTDHPNTQILKNLRTGFVDLCDYIASLQNNDPSTEEKEPEAGE